MTVTSPQPENNGITSVNCNPAENYLICVQLAESLLMRGGIQAGSILARTTPKSEEASATLVQKQSKRPQHTTSQGLPEIAAKVLLTKELQLVH